MIARIRLFSVLLSLMCSGVGFGDESTDQQGELADRQCVIVVVGAPGKQEYAVQLTDWAGRLREAAAAGDVVFERLGTGSDATAEESTAEESTAEESTAEESTAEESTADVVTSDSGAEASASDLEQLRRLLSRHGSVVTDEPLWLILLGHGSFDTRNARFNLRGPDLSAAELAELASQIQRPLAVVCSFSCSSPFLNELSAENRIIVTATKDGNQVQWNRFGDAFSRAFISEDSDIDRDGQTSLLEAWLYASRRTADFYATEGRLASEHSLLDDNGDGAGSRGESFVGVRPAENLKEPEKLDGRIARKWHFVRSDEERRLTREQRRQRDALELELEALKAKKSSLEEAAYLDALEAILLQLGEIYRAADAPADETVATESEQSDRLP